MRIRALLALFSPPTLAWGGGSPTPSAPPAPPPLPPPPPLLQQPQGEAAAQEVARRSRAAQGYGNTIATGPMGVLEAPDLSKPSLGG